MMTVGEELEDMARRSRALASRVRETRKQDLDVYEDVVNDLCDALTELGVAFEQVAERN